jgi:hypothetical protein
MDMRHMRHDDSDVSPTAALAAAAAAKRLSGNGVHLTMPSIPHQALAGGGKGVTSPHAPPPPTHPTLGPALPVARL